MPLAKEPEPSARGLSAAELRQLWERGERGTALRNALDAWDRLIDKEADLFWLLDALRVSGLEVEAFALQAQLTRRRRGDAREWEAFIRGVLRSGDLWWARDLLEEAEVASRELSRLRVEVEVALGGGSDAIDAWLREYRDDAAVASAVDWWVRSGRVDEAERLLESAEGGLDQNGDLILWRARLALWRAQPEHARFLLQRLSPCPEVGCLEAIAKALEGRWAEAESLLTVLLDGESRAEAASWLATVLRKQGRYAEAVQAADAANVASLELNLVPSLEREAAVAAERRAMDAGRHLKGWARIRRFLDAVRGRGAKKPDGRRISDLEYARALYALGLRPDDPVAAIEPLLDRLGGNHTPHLTTIDDGRLVFHRFPVDPRHLGASIQLVLWTRGAEAARGLFRELAPTVEHHPLFRIYHGELELWLGDYDEAGRIFRGILERDQAVRWAWIGLGASLMLQGKLDLAQEAWKQGLSIMPFPGPTLFAYRGECYRKLGDRRRAAQDLEVAVEQKPQRLSAWINFALLQGRGDLLEAVEQHCIDLAPLLMGELGGSRTERLEKVLQAMRGNRSSSIVSYHLWGRVWRLVTDQQDQGVLKKLTRLVRTQA